MDYPRIVSTFDAVLWDLDGTLVDTEPLWMHSQQTLAAEFGARWTPEDGLDLVGRNLPESGAYIRDRMGLPLSPAAIVERLVTNVLDGLRGKIPWREGARELLVEVHRAQTPMALVTMSYRPIADLIAQTVGIFDVVITGDEVVRPKPFPDPYLEAATALGVRPERCIAIEDSPTGATAALDAGCRTVVVEGYAAVPAHLGHARWSSLTGRRIADLAAVAAVAHAP